MGEAAKRAADVRDRRTILIVEDDDILRTVLRFEFEKNGFKVLEAENGRAAIAAIGCIQPDIIITDLMMPVMDGFSFIDAVRKAKGNTVPIIAISAAKGDGMGEKAVETGASQFCEKPLSLESLLTAVRNHLPANVPPKN
ncbi:MAG: response regulator [Nitrospinae bacterium]|nr:response regulator [Nitrospinota bacterium]